MFITATAVVTWSGASAVPAPLGALSLPHHAVGLARRASGLSYRGLRATLRRCLPSLYERLADPKSSADEAAAPPPPPDAEGGPTKQRAQISALCARVREYLKQTAGESSGADEERYRTKQAREIASLHQKLNVQHEVLLSLLRA